MESKHNNIKIPLFFFLWDSLEFALLVIEKEDMDEIRKILLDEGKQLELTCDELVELENV